MKTQSRKHRGLVPPIPRTPENRAKYWMQYPPDSESVWLCRGNGRMTAHLVKRTGGLLTIDTAVGPMPASKTDKNFWWMRVFGSTTEDQAVIDKALKGG